MKIGVHKKVKIVSCYTGKSEKKGTPFFGLEFENQEGERIEHDFYLADKKSDGTDNTENVKKTLQTLLNAGYKRKSLSDMSDSKLSMEDLFGEPVDDINITIKDASYTKDDGTPVEKVEVQYFNVGYGGKSKADLAESKQIFKNTKFDGFLNQLKKGDKPARTEPKPKEKEIDTNFTSDDIPF